MLLLDPKVDCAKICKCRPLVKHSSTYIIDLDSLKHPHDVKKDNFGVWNHSGSHDMKFEPRKKSTVRQSIFRIVGFIAETNFRLCNGQAVTWRDFQIQHKTSSKANLKV